MISQPEEFFISCYFPLWSLAGVDVLFLGFHIHGRQVIPMVCSLCFISAITGRYRDVLFLLPQLHPHPTTIPRHPHPTPNLHPPHPAVTSRYEVFFFSSRPRSPADTDAPVLMPRVCGHPLIQMYRFLCYTSISSYWYYCYAVVAFTVTW